jgi:hypothetical protein
MTLVKNNTDLRKLLVEVPNKSIIVIEDIDCSIDLTSQRNGKKTEKDEAEEQKDPKQKPEKRER